MEPADFFTSLLEGLGGLSLFKAENAEFSLFKLSNSPMNFGCVTHQDYSVQIYVEAPKANPPALCVPQDLQANRPEVLDTATAPRRPNRAVAVQDDPLFSVDRTFDFDTRSDALLRDTQLNGVPICLVKPQDRFPVTLKGLGKVIDLDRRGETLAFASPMLQSASVPPGVRLQGKSGRMTKLLKGSRISDFAQGGRDYFGLFQCGPGRRLPIGSDAVRFSKAVYRDVFALCRLQPKQDATFALRTYQLIAIRKG